MSNYRIIELENIKIPHFVNIESGDNLILLSIHTGRNFEEAILTSDQAILIANELLRRASIINTENPKEK